MYDEGPRDHPSHFWNLSSFSPSTMVVTMLVK